MSTIPFRLSAKKQIPGLVAAIAMTLFLGLAMAVLGINALLNENTAPLQSAAFSPDPGGGGQAASDLIAQYQAREQQYQTELQQAADQLSQTQAQLAQYQQLVAVLQNAGIIQINPNGQVFLMPGAFGDD